MTGKRKRPDDEDEDEDAPLKKRCPTQTNGRKEATYPKAKKTVQEAKETLKE